MNTQNFNTQENIAYERAAKRVKKLKGFYIHCLVYVVINSMIFLGNVYSEKEPISSFNNYGAAILWGIGLFFHGFNVFGFDFILGRDWEERKIRELMEKSKN
jgi:hypothetical protein